MTEFTIPNHSGFTGNIDSLVTVKHFCHIETTGCISIQIKHSASSSSAIFSQA